VARWCTTRYERAGSLPAPTPEQREYAELLLERANSDLAACRVLIADEDMLDDVVGFHAQQAVEKALKMALVLADVDFPRSHDLRELGDVAEDNGVEVPDAVREARWLTPWAAQLRYEMLEPIDRDAALAVATAAVEWAKGLLDRPRLMQERHDARRETEGEGFEPSSEV
jgi:HEPN domain-containing protein